MNEKKKIDVPGLLALLAICIVIAVFWNTVVVYPLKLFVVLLHEVSHGLAALLTGGGIERIEINTNEGGVCFTRGGSRFVVLTAGYLGSMLWGGVILVSAARSRFDKWISMTIGLLVLVITALYIRNTAGLVFGILFGGGLIALGQWAPMTVNDFVLRVIGLTSILYAVIDIKDDLISRQIPTSDASRLAAEYFGTPVMWGIIWIILAFFLSWAFLKAAARG